LSGVAENRTLTAVPGITVGHAQHGAGETGCTVAIGPFVAAVEVRGLATGSRELDALSPLHLVPRCDAILLTGGSAFGLAAADGVSRWLEERGRGYETRAAVVPIVPAAVIYDLGMGDASARPDPEMGYAAAAAASERSVEEGRVGVGAGASVGKLRPEGLEPAGVGSWSEDHGEHVVAALAVVNAFGDVLDDRGEITAGSRGPDGSYLDTARAIREGRVPDWLVRAGENTTLAIVATDIPLRKTELQVVARQAMNAVVRRISPANTSFDGDIVFAASSAENAGTGPDTPPIQLLSIGLQAQRALERALLRAVRT
jgi:L-aminopeptidase/D-esterase-like protein